MTTILAQADRLSARPAASDAFERLFAREYPRVVAIARRVLGEADAAQDVAQDVFVAFHRGHDSAAPFAATWLHRAAVHLALNHLRKARRRSAREASQAALEPRGQGADPAAETLRREERREVRAALARLRARDAAALALRYAGLSYAEVATALGIAAGSVGTVLVRAESAFKKELARVSPR